MGDIIKLCLQLSVEGIFDGVSSIIGRRIDLNDSQWSSGCWEGSCDKALIDWIPVEACAPQGAVDGNSNSLESKMVSPARVQDCVASYVPDSFAWPSDFRQAA